MENETSLSILRAFNGYQSQQEGLFGALLAQHLEDKEISLDTIRYMAINNTSLGALVRDTLMRGRGNISEIEMNFVTKMLYTSGSIRTLDVETYEGSAAQNRVMDHALTLYNDKEFFIGESAMSRYIPSRNKINESVRAVPIAIIGRGAAGIMINAALRIQGFGNITMFDKHGSSLGIWGQPNVSGGTKNNPRQLDFAGLNALGVAQGDGTRDGHQVLDFISGLGRRFDQFDASEKIFVNKVESGDLKNIIHFEQNKQSAFAEYPIVINCMGTGKPREFSDRTRMTLAKSSKRPVAVRWQQLLTQKDVQDKRFAIIGLGNSTAEMISQLNEFRNKGVNCDYKVFTHYPEDSVMNPTERVQDDDGNYYRVFRDLSKPDLTGFQGDLPRAREDYFRALREDRIVSGVKSWSVRDDGAKYLDVRAGNHHDESYLFDKLFVLTGYKHDMEELEGKYSLDCENGYPAADYDGEFRNHGTLMKGYFGLGALMDSPHDPNAVVIPGMMFRIPDMMFTIVCRAFEHLAAINSKD